jgi:hypothetical protein
MRHWQRRSAGKFRSALGPPSPLVRSAGPSWAIRGMLKMQLSGSPGSGRCSRALRGNGAAHHHKAARSGRNELPRHCGGPEWPRRADGTWWAVAGVECSQFACESDACLLIVGNMTEAVGEPEQTPFHKKYSPGGRCWTPRPRRSEGAGPAFAQVVAATERLKTIVTRVPVSGLVSTFKTAFAFS